MCWCHLFNEISILPGIINILERHAEAMETNTHQENPSPRRRTIEDARVTRRRPYKSPTRTIRPFVSFHNKLARIPRCSRNQEKPMPFGGVQYWDDSPGLAVAASNAAWKDCKACGVNVFNHYAYNATQLERGTYIIFVRLLPPYILYGGIIFEIEIICKGNVMSPHSKCMGGATLYSNVG